MKVKKRILSFVLAAAVAVAACPIAAYAESEPSGEAQSRAAMRHIRGEIEARERHEAEQEARAAEAENEETANAEAEAAAADPAVITVSSGNYAAEQGGRLKITNDKLSVEGDYTPYDSVNGKVTFTGAETYEVNYSRISVFEEEYENGDYVYNMILYLPREIKPGAYAVSVDLESSSSYDKYIVNGGFDLTVSEPAAEVPIISALDENGEPADAVSVNYDEYFNVSPESGYVNNVYAISPEGGKNIYMLSSANVSYESGVSAGDYNLSALIRSSSYDSETGEYLYNYGFSNSVKLTLNQPEKIETDQTSPAEILNGYNYNDMYNNEISFKQPVEVERYADWKRRIVNKQSGETLTGNSIYCEFVYNEKTDEESGDIYNEYTGVTLMGHSLPEGEYELYFYTGGKEIGPIDVNCYSYYLNNLYYTTLLEGMNLSYNFDYDDPIRESYVVSANITVSDEGGNVLASVETAPSNYYGGSMRVAFIMDTPSIPADGAYVLSTELNFADGTSRRLLSRHIYIGEYYTPTLSSDHEYITPETKSIGVTVSFDYAISDPNDIYLMLIDPSGKEVGRSSSVYNTSLNSSSAIYVIDLTEDMSAAEPGGAYIIKPNSVKNIEFRGGSTEISLTLRDVPIIVSSKRSGQNTYDFIMENIEPGTYETYNYNDHADGTLSVESGGAAVLIMNDPDSYSGSFYLHTGTLEDGSYVITELYFDSVYEYADVPSVSQNESALVIRSGASSVKNCHYTIYTKTMPKSNDISSIKLLSGGNVMAEGENIRVSYANYEAYRDCWRTEALVDFPTIDMTKAVDGSAVLQIITTFGELTANCMIVPENEYVPVSRRSYINVSNISGDYVSSDNIPFEIYNTNFTEGEIQLYELGEMTDSGQEVKLIASKPLSELKRTDGLLYSYTGSFTENIEPGKQYSISYYNKKLVDAGVNPENVIGNTWSEFTATDKPMIYSYYNSVDNYNYVASDNQYLYAMAININYDTDKVAACYYDESGNKVDIPLTAEKSESYNEFGEVYEASYQARFTFDFSNVPAFDEMDVHMLVNDEEIEVLSFRDSRGECFVQYAGISGNQDKECIYIEGYNLDKGDITLRIYDTGEYNYETTIGEKVRETAVKADNNEYSGYMDYRYFPLDSLYLPEGKYCYELCRDGEPIISAYDGYISGVFTIGAAEVDPDIPAAVTGSVVEGSEMKVDLLNMSSGEIKANVIVGAYDENDVLIDLSSEVPVTIAPNGELKGVSVPTAADAARYKVFVWDSLKDMRPYSKAN